MRLNHYGPYAATKFSEFLAACIFLALLFKKNVLRDYNVPLPEAFVFHMSRSFPSQINLYKHMS